MGSSEFPQGIAVFVFELDAPKSAGRHMHGEHLVNGISGHKEKATSFLPIYVARSGRRSERCSA